MLPNLIVLLLLFGGAAALARYLFGVGVANQEENEAAFNPPKNATLPIEQYTAPIGPGKEEATVPTASDSFRGAPRYDLYDAPGVPSIAPDVQIPPSTEVVAEPEAQPVVNEQTTNSPLTTAAINEAMTIASAATLIEEPVETVIQVESKDESAPSYLSDVLPTVAFSASTRAVPDATGEPSVIRSEMIAESSHDDLWDYFSC
jgi:hypothetical protein